MNAILVAVVILLAVATYLALGFAPLEASMGLVQKVFYFHVATAWVGMLGFIAAGYPGYSSAEAEPEMGYC
jgi:heme exporter protein C